MRKIIHIDMDCFYAAVETKYNPQLKGKALGIGGPADSRSVLCTANYEARRYGVRAAMPSSKAVRLCPHLILLPPQFDLYKKESQRVFEILKRFSDKVEPLSLDEAYIDVTDSKHFKGSATLIAQEIRRLIFLEVGLTASAGVAPNKFLAKVASDWNKPNGLFVIKPDEVESFLLDLPIEKIFGVGKVTAEKFHQLGIKTCGELRNKDLFFLKRHFGSRAFELYELSLGIDKREVISHWEPKSLTVEETFDKDVGGLDELLPHLPRLYEEWQSRFSKKPHLQNRVAGVVVKIKTTDFQQSTKEVAFAGVPTLQDFVKLLTSKLLQVEKKIRLVGIGVRLHGSEKDQQLALIS
ncbi:MAG: DNA polymerase IV [Bdellovibrionia bacterium]